VRARRLAGLVALLAVVLVGGISAAGALGRQAQSPLIVVDHSIGGISIGMTQAQVEALYGPPGDSSAITVLGGGTGSLVHYHVHGGLLIVTYANGLVVSVSTNSSFYKTRAGVGPGSAYPLRPTAFGEDFCPGGAWDGGEGTGPTTVVTVFERDGGAIGDVIVAQFAYYDLCESVGANQELPDPRPPSVALSASVAPGGAGWVRSTPYGIDCPTACSRPFARDSSLSLEAHPTNGFTFTGWTGACTGAGACVVTMDEDKSVTAHFTGKYVPPPPPPPDPPGGGGGGEGSG
jgi:uncharacterized repeat protein (TIGR02543 family)